MYHSITIAATIETKMRIISEVALPDYLLKRIKS
jgi:hypothetical protein